MKYESKGKAVGGIKIPYIRLSNKYWRERGCKWTIVGRGNTCDVTHSLGHAIRYLLWHWGVPAKIAFWGI